MWKSHEKPIVIDLFQTGNHGFSTSTSVFVETPKTTGVFQEVHPGATSRSRPRKTAVNGDLSNEVESMGIYRIYQQC